MPKFNQIRPVTVHVHMELIDQMLGTASNNPELHSEFIASKAPDAMTRAQEIEAIGTVEYEEKGMTVFPRTPQGDAMLWAYQIIGHFKESAQAVRRMDGSLTKKLAAHRKVIEQCVFVQPDAVPIVLPKGGFIGDLQRPLRAQTAQGERVAIAHSETVPAGSTLDFDVMLMDGKYLDYVLEWLWYGQFHGLGQWRNSGKGRYRCRAVDGNGEVLLDTFAGE